MSGAKFWSKRMVLSLLGMGLMTALCYLGKVGGEQFIYGLAVILAGHHAADLIKAWRGTPTSSSSSP